MSRCKECIRLAGAPTTVEPHVSLVEELPRIRELPVQTFRCGNCGTRWQRDLSQPAKHWTLL